MVGTIGTLFKEGERSSRRDARYKSWKIKNREDVNYLDIIPKVYAYKNILGKVLQEEEDLDNIGSKGFRWKIEYRYKV